jgi:hypothetical protein
MEVHQLDVAGDVEMTDKNNSFIYPTECTTRLL